MVIFSIFACFYQLFLQIYKHSYLYVYMSKNAYLKKNSYHHVHLPDFFQITAYNATIVSHHYITDFCTSWLMSIRFPYFQNGTVLPNASWHPCVRREDRVGCFLAVELSGHRVYALHLLLLDVVVCIVELSYY